MYNDNNINEMIILYDNVNNINNNDKYNNNNVCM